MSERCRCKYRDGASLCSHWSQTPGFKQSSHLGLLKHWDHSSGASIDCMPTSTQAKMVSKRIA
ncbi:ARMC6 isoform 20, partial [Pongo abelii]